ncbi:MAG: group III truncated hemoglobin, partial [Crocinitomicaceae bacterium]
QDNWPRHLEKMYTFWQTVLLKEHTYFGSPFVPHAKLPVEQEHFTHWIDLFYKTIDEQFVGEKANEAKWRAEKMAEMFLSKIQYYRQNPDKVPI